MLSQTTRFASPTPAVTLNDEHYIHDRVLTDILLTTDTPRLTPPRVLIVDDNADAADTLGALLAHFECEVSVAYSGAEALALGEDIQAELVFLDIGMARMDGYETARRMRERPWGRHAMIVALTAWDDSHTRARVAGAGMDAHLTKPASLDRMLAMVARLHR
jgi:CheY-like chemotaxis protein